MATLEKIRSKSGLLIAFVGIALAAFVAGDAFNIGSSASSDMNTVGSVEGVELSRQDFQDEVSLYGEVRRMQYPQNLTDADMREGVWYNFVRSTLFKKKAEELGIAVTKDELTNSILGKNVHPYVTQIPLFRNEQGVFDQNSVRALLQFANTYRGATDANGNLTNEARQAEMIDRNWKFWASEIENFMYAEKVVGLMGKAMSSPKKEVEFMKRISEKNFDALVCKKMYSAIVDSTIAVSDNDINAFYSKNKEDYKVDEGYRSLKMVFFPIRPSQADVENSKIAMEDVKKQLTEIKDEDVPVLISGVSDENSQYYGVYKSENDIDFTFKDFAFTAGKGAVADVAFDGYYYKTAKVMSDVVSRPDSVRFSHILLGRTVSMDELQKKADSLMALIKDGTPFDSLLSNSMDIQSAKNGGDLGWVKEGMIGLQDFDSLAFAANVGKVFTVNGNNGIHIIKITDKTAPVKKVKLAVASSMLQPSSETGNDIYNRANQFVMENTDLEAFMKAAKDSGLMMMPLERLSENQYRYGNMDDIREIVRWAWEEERVIGDVSGVYDVKDAYVVVSVSDIVEKGYAPVSSVRNELEARVRDEKKGELLLKELASVSEADMTDTVKAVRFGMEYLSGVGSERALIGAICSAAEGQISKPVVGKSGVYVFKVLSSAPESSFVPDKKSIDANVRTLVNGSLFGVLKKNAEIEDKRALHY